MTKKKKPEDLEKVGAKTKYSLELAEKIASEQTHSTIKESYTKYGISKQTYYNWMLKHPEFFDLSTQARKINAVDLYSQGVELLMELKEKRSNPDNKDLVPVYRLLFDGYLRLAGKANQGLFGDQAKNNIQVSVDNKDVDVPTRQTQEEWEANA